MEGGGAHMHHRPGARERPTLRARLLRAWLLAVTLPLLLLCLAGAWLFARRDRAAASERLAEAARAIADASEAHIAEHQRAILDLAENLRAVALDDETALEAWLARMRRHHPGFLTLLVAARDGGLRAVEPQVTATGAPRSARGRSVADRAYFREPLHTGRPYVSDAFRGRGFGHDPIVALSAPLRAPDGSIAGVVEGSLDLTRLRDAGRMFLATPGTEVVILDRAGAVIFASSGEAPLQHLSPAHTGAGSEARVFEGPGGGGDPCLIARHVAPVSGWTILARRPLRLIRATRDRFILIGLLVAAGAISLALVLARQSARRVTAPVAGLAARIAALDLDQQPPEPLPLQPQAPAEVADLVTGFNAMAARLHESHRRLESVLGRLEALVDERTADLRDSEARLREFLEEAGDLVLQVDFDGRLRYANRAMRETLGLDSGEANLLELLAPGSREAGQALLERLSRAESVSEFEATLVSRLGFHVPVAGSANARIEHGRPAYARAILRDMTTRHELQRLQRDMTHMLVHDLRSPLSGVWGAFELLEHEAPEQRELIAVGMRATRQVMSLTESLLELGQLETGGLPLARESVPLRPLAAQVCELLGAARPDQARLDNEVPDDLPPAWADPRLLRRVLQNLLDNALRFTPPQGRVRLRARADGPAAVRVEVSDTGPGVAPDVRERLFQKFARGDHGRRGFGLGLAFCRLAVEAHGGRIGAESVPDQGATFWFTLPTAPPEAA